jgi:hypothetical protein
VFELGVLGKEKFFTKRGLMPVDFLRSEPSPFPPLVSMSSFAKKDFPADSPDTLAYRELRASGKTWAAKLLRHPASKPFDILKAARKLGLTVQDRTILFDDQTEMDILHDFYLHDYRPAGKNVIESCTFADGELTLLEAEFQQAALAARSSCFEVVTVHETEPKTLLRERLDPAGAEVWLTDFGFSASFRRLGRAFLFTRLIAPRGVPMTTGFGFVFDPRHESALVDGCRRALWSASTLAQRSSRRMAFFFDLNRKIGKPLALEEI